MDSVIQYGRREPCCCSLVVLSDRSLHTVMMERLNVICEPSLYKCQDNDVGFFFVIVLGFLFFFLIKQ